MTRRTLLLLALAFLAARCGGADALPPLGDGGDAAAPGVDAASPDGDARAGRDGLDDTARSDAGPADTARRDTGPADTARLDTGPADTARLDTAPPEAGPTDTAPPDAGPGPRIDPTETPAALALPVGDDQPPPALPDGVAVRALTFNIHGGGDASPEAIGALLAAQDADLVGLQECPAEAVAAIAAAAGLPHHTGGSGAVLLSATPLEDVATIGLPGGRSVVHAETSIDGVRFSVYSAHIGWDAAGDAQARALVDDVLAADPLPHLVLVGDFNDEHLSTQNTILDEVLRDAQTVAGFGPGERISWPATEFDGSEGSQLIDLVFFRRDLPAIVVAADVLNLAPVLSDHKPSRADLLFPRDAAAPFAEDPYAARRDPWAAWPPEGERPPNLLVNPGAEEGLAGWEPVGEPTAVAARRQLAPFAGDAFFTGPEATVVGVGARAGASQVVDLSTEAGAIDAGRGRVYVSARMALGYDTASADGFVSNRLTPNDHAEVIVLALDGDGLPLRRVASGRRDPYAWFPWAGALDLPPGTRAVRFTWLGHQHPWHGGGNDAAFDDLYLGFAALATPHALRGGDLVSDGGAVSEAAGAALAPGWYADEDLRSRGLMQFPPWSWSGGRHFYAGGERFRLDPGPAEPATLAWELDLGAHAEALAAGTLALRWGGRVRTWRAATTVTLALEIRDGDGTPWGEVAAPPVAAAEWTAVTQRTRIPAGAGGARLVVRADVAAAGVAAFADALFALPERLAP